MSDPAASADESVLAVDEIRVVGLLTWMMALTGVWLVEARSLSLDVAAFDVVVGPIVLGTVTFGVLLAGRRLAVPRDQGRLLIAAMLLVTWGWILQCRISPSSARTTLGAVVVGGALMVLGLVIGRVALPQLAALDERGVRRAGWAAFGVATALLALTVLVGIEVNGSRAWVTVPGGTYQPGELARLGLVVAVASILGRRTPTSPLRGDVVRPLVVMVAVAVGILFVQLDLSPALLLGLVLVGMVWIHHGRWYLLGATLVGGLALWVAYRFLHGSLGHVGVRLRQVGRPFASADEASGLPTQLGQALLSHRRGGLAGTGLGRGRPGSVSLADSDFVLSGAAEELGVLGLVLLLVPVGVVLATGWSVVRRQAEGVVQLVVAGLVLVLGVSWALTLLGTVGLVVPHGGLAIPLLSNGGSSLTTSLLAIGVVAGATSERLAASRAGLRLSTRRRPGDRAAVLAGPWGRAAMVCAAVVAIVSPLPLADPLTRSVSEGRNGAEDAEHIAARAWEQGRVHRGAIVAADGTVLAHTWSPGDPPCAGWSREPSGPARCYPEERLMSDVTGGWDETDPTGMEDVLAPLLVGCGGDEGGARALAERVLAAPCRARSVRLTIDATLQARAGELLAGHAGVVVAIDPRSGAVRALVSTPGAPVGQRAGPDLTGDLTESVATSPPGFDPAVSTARRRLLPAGSVIKLVTVLAAVVHGEAHDVSAAEVAPFADLEGGACWGSIDVILGTSCNAGVAALSERLPDGAVDEVATDLGFGARSRIDGLDLICSPLPVAGGGAPGDGCPAAEEDSLGRKVSGLAYVPVTPMQVALMVAMLANGGEAVDPHVVADAGDRAALFGPPQPPDRSVDEQAARRVLQAMAAVVDPAIGTAGGAFPAGLDAVAKTGTAQRERDDVAYQDGWTVAAAPLSAPELVVVVWVAGAAAAPTDGPSVAPIAAELLAVGR